MVTEPVAAVEPATPAAGLSYGVRLALTLLLMGLFVLGHWMPLPFVAPEIFAWVEMPRTPSLMMLGTAPLFFGFILVELFALATSPGRRLRAAGPAGRAKLNRAALIAGLGLSAAQAFGIASVLATMTTPAGMPAVSLPGPVFRILLIATLTAVTAALFFLGSFLSEYGIGNGFSLLILTQIGLSLWEVWAPRFFEETAGLPGSSPIQGGGILLVGVLAALLIRHVQSSEASRTPPFPQSTFPLVLAGAVVNSSLILPRFFEGQDILPWFAGPVAFLFAVPFFSWPAYHLFSSRGRLDANLSEPEEVLDGLSDILSRRFLTATAFLTVGGAALTAWSWIQPDTYVAVLHLPGSAPGRRHRVRPPGPVRVPAAERGDGAARSTGQRPPLLPARGAAGGRGDRRPGAGPSSPVPALLPGPADQDRHARAQATGSTTPRPSWPSWNPRARSRFSRTCAAASPS